jgi:hypothetical protein
VRPPPSSAPLYLLNSLALHLSLVCYLSHNRSLARLSETGSQLREREGGREREGERGGGRERDSEFGRYSSPHLRATTARTPSRPLSLPRTRSLSSVLSIYLSVHHSYTRALTRMPCLPLSLSRSRSLYLPLFLFISMSHFNTREHSRDRHHSCTLARSLDLLPPPSHSLAHSNAGEHSRPAANFLSLFLLPSLRSSPISLHLHPLPSLSLCPFPTPSFAYLLARS